MADPAPSAPGAPGRSAQHWFASLVAGVTLLLIFFGANVTTYGAGDADPSWNLKFWEWFFRLFTENLPGGLFKEILHRVGGVTVGILALALAFLLRRDPRRWVRRLGWIALASVVAVGVLGGVRVKAVPAGPVNDFLRSVTGVGSGDVVADWLAMIHSPLAQSVFALMVVIALVTSRVWERSSPVESAAAAKIRRLSLFTAGFVLLQTILGAHVRHLDGNSLALHIIGALVVTVHVILVCVRALSARPQVRAIRVTALMLAALLFAQIFLGIGALVVTLDETAKRTPTMVEALLRSGHVVVGAMILATSVALSLLAYAMLRPPASAAVSTETAVKEASA